MNEAIDGSSEPKVPETPFDGVVVSRDVGSYSTSAGYLRSKVSLLIAHGESPEGEKPAVIVYEFTVSSEPEPNIHLRPGHKVRVRKVFGSGRFIRATEVTFDLSQFPTAAAKE